MMGFKRLSHVVVLFFSLYREAFFLPSDATNQVATDNSMPCEKDWLLFGRSCYKLELEPATWDIASARCDGLGGHLASVHSQEQQDFLTTSMLLEAKTPLWIGMSDRTQDGSHVWVDGSDADYVYWNPGQPSQYYGAEKEDCVEMRYKPQKGVTGQWNDESCKSKRAHICQKERNETLHSQDPLLCSLDDGGGRRFHGTCYNLVTEKRSWQDAEQYCQDHFKGHLVTISNYNIDMFVNYTLRNSRGSIWIGIKLRNQLQQRWTSGKLVAYNFLPNDTSSHTEEEHCVIRSRPKLWIETPCYHDYPFICEISKDEPSTLKDSLKGWKCPDSSKDWRDLDGELCYYFDTSSSVSWYEANNECVRRGGNLASVLSQEDSDMLHLFVENTQERLFIGINALLSNGGIYMWADGNIVNFTNWYPGEPNNHNEKCGELWTDSMQWNDIPCDVKKGFICSVRKVPPDEVDSTNETEYSKCAPVPPVEVDSTNETECSKCAPAFLNGNTAEKQVESQEGAASFNNVAVFSVIAILLVLLTGLLVYNFQPWLQNKRMHISSVIFKSKAPELDTEHPHIWSKEAIITEDEHYSTIK